MKAKLLKKIRKQYSIVYYPDGMLIDGKYIFHYNQYVVHKSWRSVWAVKGYDTKQQAINDIIKEVRNEYRSYSRKYKKPNYKGIKVWHTK